MLFIAEKKELAKAIVDGLGGGTAKDGHFVCGPDRVTWCFGHMLQLCDPEDYDPELRRWNVEQLPMVFVPWRKKPIPDKKEQLDKIITLLRSTDCVVHAGDPDAEGQLLVDEILEYANFKGTVKRVLINDNNPKVVKKALENLRDNAEFAGQSRAAEARQVGDNIYGINMTRLYTVLAQREGYPDTVSIGRVQMAVLGLVVRRDRQFTEHAKQEYYSMYGVFRFGDSRITATYLPEPTDMMDSDGRLVDISKVKAVIGEVANQAATIESIEEKEGQTPPPLPYNLLKLQADASRMYGYLPDKVKEITQSLREKHRLITYNRSDCQYLSDEQHADADEVIAAIRANYPEFTGKIAHTDTSIKGRAFDSSKVSAHHAIVPSQTRADFTTLSVDEKRIYALIARAYLIQFMQPAEYKTITAIVSSGGHKFSYKTTVSTKLGWREHLDAGDATDEDEPATAAPTLTAQQEGVCISAEYEEKHTTPKPLYTVPTLLENLTGVAGEVRDQNLRKILVQKDKGKTGEHGGIGTPATRDEVIKTLLERKYIEVVVKGKRQQVVSTSLGRQIYDMVPDTVRYPDLTAIWQQNQISVESGDMAVKDFVENVGQYVADEVSRITAEGLKLDIEKHPCPQCGNALLRKKSAKGFFWGCSTYPKCTATMADENGKPVEDRTIKLVMTDIPCPACKKPLRQIFADEREFFGCSGYPDCKKVFRSIGGKPQFDGDKPIASEIHKCEKCGKGLVRREKGCQFFWGCSGYPKCRTSYPDIDGKPNYTTKSKEKK